MKHLLFAAAMILSTHAAHASPTSCRENVDHGYSVNFSQDLADAQVIQTTIADEKVIANLKCGPAEIAPPSRPGRIIVVASCYEPIIRDAGYALTVKQNSRNGATTATLSQVTFVGTNPIAEMACQ